MRKGVVLLALPEASPFAPELLADTHPLLAADARALGPWHPATLAGVPAWEGSAPLPVRIAVCGSCASSLDAAWSLVRQEALAPWDSVLAVAQEQGRGQLRRPWHSPPGNVYAAWRLPESFAALGDAAAPAAGWLAVQGFRGLGLDLRLKWPNDLLLEERKVGGLLLEERGGVLLAGLGLNLASAPDSKALGRDPWAPPAGRLLEALDAVPALRGLGPLRLWALLLQGLRRTWTALEERNTAIDVQGRQSISIHAAGRAALQQAMDAVLAWKGRKVTVRGAGGENPGGIDTIEGVVVGISSDGALRLACADGERLIRSGSVLPV